ncbi:uncharacterized protein ARMOST_07621 [Armillaria ostoyae]|uniref:FAD dependent oxidoreductase domain-containing protein n=1 Tax=Armillaria ostoyae TaxID=47428 RepID=A0A284R6E0_ARMOS|nr:uncharacterized protein ARMOST_07621 [Armillaria ostoyae]
MTVIRSGTKADSEFQIAAELRGKFRFTLFLPFHSPGVTLFAHGVYADVLVIGCGITGTPFVRTLLEADWTLEAVICKRGMIDECSWATPRNGDVMPPLYRRECTLRGYAGHLDDDGWGSTSISTCHGDPLKAPQDVLIVPAVHALLVSPSTTTSSTPCGNIRAKHIVHATNGWTSHLLAPIWEKLVSVRGRMTAQRAGTWLGRWMARYALVCTIPKHVRGSMRLSHPATARPCYQTRRDALRRVYGVASRWAHSPPLTPSDVLTTVKSNLECPHTSALPHRYRVNNEQGNGGNAVPVPIQLTRRVALRRAHWIAMMHA